jgi:hypothetical protein
VPPGAHPAVVLVPFGPIFCVFAAEVVVPIFPFFQLEGLCHVFVLDEFPCCIVISLPLAFLLSCLPEGVALSLFTAGLVVFTMKTGGRLFVRLLLIMCSMMGSMSMILLLMADLSTSCLHSLSQRWMQILNV